MTGQLIFLDTAKELKHLRNSDPKMGKLIDLIGDYTLSLRTDFYRSLIRTIIGQQLSFKAARTIWGRLERELGEVSPEHVLVIPDEKLRSIGLSRQKITYAKHLSDMVLNGEIDLDTMNNLSDEEVMGSLIKVKGIGRWSAEMFMIFSLGRLDILSVDDVGLKRAIQWLYELSEQPNKERMQKIGEAWQPYRTIASLYLWEVVNKDLLKS